MAESVFNAFLPLAPNGSFRPIAATRVLVHHRAMTFAKSAILFACVSAFAPNVAARTPEAPVRLEHLSYLKARKIILHYNWMPLRGGCSGGDTSATICSNFPEIGNCSGSDEGFCDMTFVKPGRCLTVVTIGGAPRKGRSEPVVRDVQFSKGHCSKDPNA